MINKVFAVKDIKVGAFMAPFFMRSKGEAIRAFTDFANDGQSMPSKHPEDFCLYEIGTWDDDTGSLVSIPMESLGLAADFVRSKDG